MKKKISGPVITLAAAAALGIALFSVNVAQETEPAPPTQAAATASPTTQAPTTTPAPTTPAPTTPPPAAFPAQADYVAEIPTANGTIVLDIAIDGATATAYACDNVGIEEWLAGSAANGVLDLASNDQSSQLDGRLEGSAVVGTLSIDEKEWSFTAAAVAGANDVR